MTEAIPPFLQQLFDRGIDPLDDARAREWLLEHPEALPSFVTLRETLATIARAPTPVEATPVEATPVEGVAGHPSPAFNGRALTGAGAIAAAVFVALGLLFWSNPSVPSQGATEINPLPRPNLPTTGRVVDYRVASSRLAGAASERHVVTHRGLGGVQTHRATRIYESGPRDLGIDAPTDHAITIRGVTQTIAHVLE